MLYTESNETPVQPPGVSPRLPDGAVHFPPHVEAKGLIKGIGSLSGGRLTVSAREAVGRMPLGFCFKRPPCGPQ